MTGHIIRPCRVRADFGYTSAALLVFGPALLNRLWGPSCTLRCTFHQAHPVRLLHSAPLMNW